MADDDAELLTYAELGVRLGISAEGARTRAKRSGWPKVEGNDGLLRVRVPLSALPQYPPKPARSDTGQTAGMAGLLAELRVELEQVRSTALQWRSAAEQARVDVVKAEAERDGIRAVAQAEIRARDKMIEELRAQAAREIARGDALAAELRRPWWRRWLGR